MLRIIKSSITVARVYAADETKRSVALDWAKLRQISLKGLGTDFEKGGHVRSLGVDYSSVQSPAEKHKMFPRVTRRNLAKSFTSWPHVNGQQPTRYPAADVKERNP
jgi:hypothetical protein